MVLQIRGRVLDAPLEWDNLEDFFEANPEIGAANLLLTEMEHVSMWREEVLFIKQRQQATSDYRENKRVRWIGSHAALTCHIAVMRHTESGVASIGHFDNFCCWQFGEESSAHKDGITIMLDEIAFLSESGADDGQVEVSVVGGYEDTRGDAAKNSLSLLRALHEDPRTIELRHFCVGSYNTQEAESYLGGSRTAILKGIALDLQTQMLFPAIFDWANFSDFALQIRDKLRLRMGESPLDTEERHKTADSTFKPKSLRNKNGEKKKRDEIAKAEAEDEANKRRRRKSSYLEPMFDFNVRLRPTGINENAAGKKTNNNHRINFRKLEKET